MSDLTFRFAKTHVDMYDSARDVIKNHCEAMDCHNCVDFIKLGIETHGWLLRADAACRDLESLGPVDESELHFDTLETLMRRWLSICEEAGSWIDLQLQRGFEIEDFDEFKVCEERVRLSLEELDADNEVLSPAMQKHQDDAIQEHANGETAKFV